jgi:hypothetical protein
VAGTFAARRTHRAPRRGEARAARSAVRGEPRARNPRNPDQFLDIVIMISVALFMLLFIGVGILVLQNSLR